MEVLDIFIILLIILLLYKIINVEKYETIKEPFFTLWVSAEKKYEYNTIYVEISDYEKGLIHEIEYKSPELYISNMSKNEYILPVDYSDDFKDYLGKKVSIKFYRNSKNQSDLFHITHTMLPYSKEDESSFDTSKLENDEGLIFEEDTYKEEDQVHDCIGEWKESARDGGGTFTEKRLGLAYLKSETNADKWQALLKRPLYNKGALIKAEGMPTLAKGSSEPTTRIQPEYQIGGQEWTYEHIKPAKNGGKECPYQNGKTIKTLYSGSMNFNYTSGGDGIRAPWGMYLAPEAWAPFLNPNINGKIIDDPEYIVTTKNPTYNADMNDVAKKKKEEEDAAATKKKEEEDAAAAAVVAAAAAAAAERMKIQLSTLQSFTYNGLLVKDNEVLAKVGGKWGILSRIFVQRYGFQRSGYGIDGLWPIRFKTGVVARDDATNAPIAGGMSWFNADAPAGWEIHRNPDNSFYVKAITGILESQVRVKTGNFMANENGIVVVPINSGGKRYEMKTLENRNTWTENYPPDPGIFIESIMFKAHIPKL